MTYSKREEVGQLPSMKHSEDSLAGKGHNSEVLEHAKLPSIFGLLCQRWRSWLGHNQQMEDGRDLLYREMSEEMRPIGHPELHFQDIIKEDLKRTSVGVENWQGKASAHSV